MKIYFFHRLNQKENNFFFCISNYPLSSMWMYNWVILKKEYNYIYLSKYNNALRIKDNRYFKTYHGNLFSYYVIKD